jgi:hypothetical protein
VGAHAARAAGHRRFEVAKRSEIYGGGTFYDRLRRARRYVPPCRLARRLTSPTAVLAPELEQFFPGQSRRLYGELRAPKRLLHFTVAQGAQFHCEPMAQQLRTRAGLRLARALRAAKR